MALMLPRSVFFHIPKTGGSWVRQAVKNAGIPAVEVGCSPQETENAHNCFSSVDTAGKFTFAFVRHPVDWYPSFWSHRMATGWKKQDCLDPYISEDFSEFMRNVLRHIPGQLTRRYERYVGSPPGAIDFVGKQENLEEDLIRALRLAGEEFDEGRIRATPRENVSAARPWYPEDLLRGVLESEHNAMIRFGYATPWTAALPWI